MKTKKLKMMMMINRIYLFWNSSFIFLSNKQERIFVIEWWNQTHTRTHFFFFFIFKRESSRRAVSSTKWNSILLTTREILLLSQLFPIFSSKYPSLLILSLTLSLLCQVVHNHRRHHHHHSDWQWVVFPLLFITNLS